MNLSVRYYSLLIAKICYFHIANFRNFTKITGCVFFKIRMLLLKSKQFHWQYHFTHDKFTLESIFSLNSFFSYHFWVPTVFLARAKMRTFIILARWTVRYPYKWIFWSYFQSLTHQVCHSSPGSYHEKHIVKIFSNFSMSNWWGSWKKKISKKCGLHHSCGPWSFTLYWQFSWAPIYWPPQLNPWVSHWFHSKWARVPISSLPESSCFSFNFWPFGYPVILTVQWFRENSWICNFPSFYFLHCKGGNDTLSSSLHPWTNTGNATAMFIFIYLLYCLLYSLPRTI